MVIQVLLEYSMFKDALSASRLHVHGPEGRIDIEYIKKGFTHELRKTKSKYMKEDDQMWLQSTVTLVKVIYFGHKVISKQPH